MARETRLILVRHGEALARADGIVAGHGHCRGLSELGRRQAGALRDRWVREGGVRLDAVYTSVLPRAIETAQILSSALGGREAVRDCGFCELHPGEADGMKWPDYRAEHGFDMMEQPQRPMSPGGESLVTFQERVDARFAQLLRDHAGQAVVVVCHGGVISAVSHAFTGNPIYEAKVRFDPENTSITEWLLPEGAPRWVMARHNDAAHLAGLTARLGA